MSLLKTGLCAAEFRLPFGESDLRLSKFAFTFSEGRLHLAKLGFPFGEGGLCLAEFIVPFGKRGLCAREFSFPGRQAVLEFRFKGPRFFQNQQHACDFPLEIVPHLLQGIDISLQAGQFSRSARQSVLAGGRIVSCAVEILFHQFEAGSRVVEFPFAGEHPRLESRTFRFQGVAFLRQKGERPVRVVPCGRRLLKFCRELRQLFADRGVVAAFQGQHAGEFIDLRSQPAHQLVLAGQGGSLVELGNHEDRQGEDQHHQQC